MFAETAMALQAGQKIQYTDSRVATVIAPVNAEDEIQITFDAETANPKPVHFIKVYDFVRAEIYAGTAAQAKKLRVIVPRHILIEDLMAAAQVSPKEDGELTPEGAALDTPVAAEPPELPNPEPPP
jgi:hypothetical protein